MPKRNIIWIVAILVAAGVVLWVTRQWPDRGGGNGVRGLESVHEAHELIRRRYLGDVDDRALEQGAIRGMIEMLDGRSSYVRPGHLAGFRDHMEGLVSGFGLRLEPGADGVVVVAPLFGSPAHQKGILPGDRITAINGRDTSTMSFEAVHAALSNPTQRTVELAVVRAYRPLKPITLVREEFHIETVTGLCRDGDGHWVYLIDPEAGIAYMRIAEFVTETADELQQAVRQMPEAGTMVLDIRDNPGGLLLVAVSVVDLLLEQGLIVTDLSPEAEPKRYLARPEGTCVTVPLVILINGQTASAAEIVAGALQANGRAVLVGEPSCGKTSVQTMYPLSHDMGQINITTSRYVLPYVSADALADAFVSPDLTVTVTPQRLQELRRLRWVSALGPGVQSPEGPSSEGPVHSTEPDLAGQIAMDPQLSVAIDLLKTPQRRQALLEQAAERRRTESDE